MRLAVFVFIGWVTAAVPFVVAATPHDPPPVFPEMVLEEDHLSYRILMWSQIYRATYGFEHLDIEANAVKEAKLREKVLCDWVDSHAPVWIDGVRVRPTLEKLTTHFNDLQNVTMYFRYSTPTPPKRVRYRWTDFLFEDDLSLPEIRSFFTYPEDMLINTFTAEEKEFTWHRPAPTIPVLPLDVIGDRLMPPTPLTIPIPVGSAAIVLLAALAMILGGPLKWSLRTRLMVLAAGIALAYAAKNIAIWEVESGTATKDHLISENDAKELFRSLHANVYRAFDYDTESAVYDTLAESVSKDLLDRLYNEIYRSLIMREAGGAVASVKAVKIFDAAINLPSDTSEHRFEVNCDWQVKGVVEHQGHKHLRTQRYRARYQVARRDGKWRLSDVEILSQERIDDDQ